MTQNQQFERLEKLASRLDRRLRNDAETLAELGGLLREIHQELELLRVRADEQGMILSALCAEGRAAEARWVEKTC